MHDALLLKGEYLNSVMLSPVPGTKGSWLKNKGNAGKISISDMRLDGVTPTAASGETGITAGIDLGTPPGQEWGTYSYLQNLEISHLPNAIGVKLQVNVSVMINVWTEQTHDGILNHNGGCNLMAFSGVGILLQVADYWSGVEIEAPLDGSTPVEMHGPATIDGVLIGPPNSIKCHYQQLIKIDATAAGPFAPPGWRGGEPARATNGWSVNGLVIDNSHGLGSWDSAITVDQGQGPKPVDAAFNNTGTLSVSESIRFADVMLPKYEPAANALYIDPATKKLCYRDAGGAKHALY